jgi:hypothetical protein
MKATSSCTTLAVISVVSFACTMAILASLAPARAMAQGHSPGSSTTAPGGGSSGTAAKSSLKLKPASDAMANQASTNSIYSYSYGADNTGRDADTIYRSPSQAAPTDNYKFGAADRQ